MAIRFRGRSVDEAPIKHTPGGEMPDPSEQHHVKAEDVEALGETEGEEVSTQFLDKAKDYLPHLLGAIAIGAGIFLLVRRLRMARLEGRSKSESERALDIDDVQPSRLMGA